MLSKQQFRELKHNIQNMEEWEFFEWVTDNGEGGIQLAKGQLKVWKASVDGFDTKTYKNVIREIVKLAHRGYGKSFLEGAHRMVSMVKYPEWQSYTTYPKREQAMYSLAYTKSFIQGSKYLDWMVNKSPNWGETKITLPNKSFSFVISPSMRTATGYHVNHGYIGEAARWADEWDEIFKSAILPMTNRKEGQIWLTSSAFGQRGFFYNHFQMGDSKIRKVFKFDVDSTEIFNQDQKNQFLEDLGALLYRQEYECEFVGSAETFIPIYVINKQTKFIPQYTIKDLVSGLVKVDYLGIDPGQAYDSIGLCGIKRMGANWFEVVLYEEHKLDHYTEFTDMVKRIQIHNPNMQTFMDSTGNQISLLQWLQSKGCRVHGVDFSNQKKQDLYLRLEKTLRSGALYIPDVNDNMLCQSQLRYIPYKMRGTHIHFPDDSLGHHALHALIVIDLGVGQGMFRMKSF